jgi:glycosyltransferase involved in cell wall biosynthesis
MRLEYVLITPARNESAFIEATLRSVVAQTVPPKRWVIVSDGSTDGTDDIVRKYAAETPWIQLERLSTTRDRSFAAKVAVFNAGRSALGSTEYDIIGNLDADITFDASYFEYLLGKFADDPRLGVAGTHYVEGDFHSFRDSYISPQHVNGGCQMFRRECFEEIGGYAPLDGGGIDWVAVTTARMMGWHTRSFEDMVFHHHRRIGTAGTNEYVSQYRYGKKDYFLGGHPVWQVVRGAFQMAKSPYVIGGILVLAGFFGSAIARRPRQVSKELMRFHRAEQMSRLKQLLRHGPRARR